MSLLDIRAGLIPKFVPSHTIRLRPRTLQQRLVGKIDPTLGDRACSWDKLERCSNPACDRVVRAGVSYCCGGCDAAHVMKSDPASPEDGEIVHRVFGHSDLCDERWKARVEALT